VNEFREWFNYEASFKILIFALLAGAALPALFAVGIRFQAVGAGQQATADGHTPDKNPAMLAAAWLIYAVVVAVIIFALLFIARDFIAHQSGYPFLGAKVKK
jgi:hypothetical protein